ncbi:MAG TPA: hypothetical protein VKY24_08355 [Reyranella sp.]|nr:hypothetical protein [Reyranella sp.]
MFEKIVVRRVSNRNNEMDPGLLAEVLLFYGQVHLLLDRGMFGGLLRTVGAANLLRMLRAGYVRATYIREMPVIMTNRARWEMHSPLQIQVGGKDGKKQWGPEDELKNMLVETGFSKQQAKRLARQFLTAMPVGKLNNGTPGGPDFSAEFSEEMRANPDQLSQARLVVDHFLPQQTSAYLTRFRLHEEGPNSFVIDTDLNWKAAHADCIRINGPDATFTPAWILGHIHDGFIDLGLAARFGSELLTAELPEEQVTSRAKQIMQTRLKSENEIANFNQRVLGDAFAVRDAINNKAKTFSEFLDLMDKARRFKEMLVGANPDVGLFESYISEVKRDIWLDRLGPKTMRFGLFAVAGAAIDALAPTGLGTAAGLTLGGFDTFVLDKIVRGWRPNTFVEGRLLPFVEAKTE